MPCSHLSPMWAPLFWKPSWGAAVFTPKSWVPSSTEVWQVSAVFPGATHILPLFSPQHLEFPAIRLYILPPLVIVNYGNSRPPSPNPRKFYPWVPLNIFNAVTTVYNNSIHKNQLLTLLLLKSLNSLPLIIKRPHHYLTLALHSQAILSPLWPINASHP